MNITQKFLSFSLLGAEWVMWLLVILSLISVSIMVERAIFFTGKKNNLKGILDEVKKLFSKNKFGNALEILKKEKGVSAFVALAIAEAASRGRVATEAANAALIRQRQLLERNLAFLGTVGNNAPFIGLFGTVLGIIRAFHDLSMDTQGGAGAVMSGISEALVATAIGLLVAIPAVAAYNIFQRRIRSIIAQANAVAHDLNACMGKDMQIEKEATFGNGN